jgi:hypothetical protein
MRDCARATIASSDAVRRAAGGRGVATVRAARLGRARRRRLARHAVHEIARPAVRDHHARRHHDEQRRERPDADHVVPVEVARPAAQPAPEHGHRAHRLRRPRARPPQEEAARDEEEEAEVRAPVTARPRSRHAPVPASHRCTSVDATEEAPHARGALAEHRAARRVHEHRALAPERHLHRRRVRGAQRERRRRRRPPRGGVRRRRQAAHAAVARPTSVSSGRRATPGTAATTRASAHVWICFW